VITVNNALLGASSMTLQHKSGYDWWTELETEDREERERYVEQATDSNEGEDVETNHCSAGGDRRIYNVCMWNAVESGLDWAGL